MRNFAVDSIDLRTPFFPFQNISEQDTSKLLKDQNFRQAIYLSSPTLIDEIEKYLNNTLDSKEKEKLELSVYRFFLRMCYRCTPFGMFAAFCWAQIPISTFDNICFSPVRWHWTPTT